MERGKPVPAPGRARDEGVSALLLKITHFWVICLVSQRPTSLDSEKKKKNSALGKARGPAAAHTRGTTHTRPEPSHASTSPAADSWTGWGCPHLRCLPRSAQTDTAGLCLLGALRSQFLAVFHKENPFKFQNFFLGGGAEKDFSQSLAARAARRGPAAGLGAPAMRALGLAARDSLDLAYMLSSGAMGCIPPVKMPFLSFFS